MATDRDWADAYLEQARADLTGALAMGPLPERASISVARAPRGWYKWDMARPIEPTPALRGEDAKRLLREVEQVCSPDEIKRRIERAKQMRASMMLPKNGTLHRD